VLAKKCLIRRHRLKKNCYSEGHLPHAEMDVHQVVEAWRQVAKYVEPCPVGPIPSSKLGCAVKEGPHTTGK
jgi:hypothetical protein